MTSAVDAASSVALAHPSRLDLPDGEALCTVTVVITSRNRKDDLRTALRSAVSQSVAPEVLVIDDGSSDGTAEMVRGEFPSVRLVRHDESLGLVVRRNEGARLATGSVIVSIDDDAEFSSERTLAQTLAELAHPLVGAVAIPYREPRKGNKVFQHAGEGGEQFATDSFIGTAHAIKRELFLALGGYREQLIHQGEERDLCIRMLEAGYVVRLGRADVIVHHESPRRDRRRIEYYERRNDVLFAWHNVPMPALAIHLAATTINGMKAMAHAQHPARMLRGLFDGYVACCRRWRERAPVSTDTYRLHRQLRKAGPLPLGCIRARLRDSRDMFVPRPQGALCGSGDVAVAVDERPAGDSGSPADSPTS